MTGLQTIKLSVGYPPNKELIKDINLTVSPGDFTALVGQNGVGKSTLIRTICSLQNPLSGEVRLGNQSISILSQSDIAKKIAVVLTGKPHSLNLSVVELIALGRHPHTGWLGILSESDKEKIEAALIQMEINYIATKKLYELSDGQLQKVMIARALAQDTELIILDEPTSHLDLKNKIDVLGLLKKISGSGKGILISTHEIQLAAQVCSKFWCVDFGKPVLEGPTNEILDSGALHDYLHLSDEIKII